MQSLHPETIHLGIDVHKHSISDERPRRFGRCPGDEIAAAAPGRGGPLRARPSGRSSTAHRDEHGAPQADLRDEGWRVSPTPSPRSRAPGTWWAGPPAAGSRPDRSGQLDQQGCAT